MKLAVIIQTHFAALQIKTMVESFLDRGHRVLISVDSHSAFSEIENWFENKACCDVIRSMPVIWCGMSQVNMFLHCLNLLSQHDDWDFALNISGSCALFKPIAELEKYLNHHLETGTDALIGHFVSKPNLAQNQEIKNWPSSPWTVVRQYANRDLNLSFPSIVAQEWIDISNSPIVHSQRRIAYHSSEDLQSKTLSVRPLLTSELETRQKYFEKNKLHIGRAWLTLKRNAVSWLLSTGCVSLPWLIMKDSFEPDESILHTVFLNEANHLNICNSNLQIDHGRTSDFSMEDWNRIIEDQTANPGRFFVRKISLQNEALEKVSKEIWLRQ